jgi:hypothetical protein
MIRRIKMAEALDLDKASCVEVNSRAVRGVLQKFYDGVDCDAFGVSMPMFSSYNPTDEFIISQQYHEYPVTFGSPSRISSFHIKSTSGDYMGISMAHGKWTITYIPNGLSEKERLSLEFQLL